MVPHSAHLVLGVSLRCDRRAPRLARRALEDALDADPVLDDARLLTSELINDAVLNSGCEADDIMRVMVRLDGGFLVISVDVPDISVHAPPAPAPETDTDGLGWRVVEHLAERWGAEAPDGQRAWAALPVSA